MISWARRRVTITSNLQHLHTSPDAQFTNAAVARDFASIPVFKRSFFGVHRRTRGRGVDRGSALSGMRLLLNNGFEGAVWL
jgi:hypothetical protein